MRVLVFHPDIFKSTVDISEASANLALFFTALFPSPVARVRQRRSQIDARDKSFRQNLVKQLRGLRAEAGNRMRRMRRISGAGSP